MRTSSNGLALIKHCEGVRLTAYPDPASGGDPWTIGYGHTIGVKPGEKITQAQADAFIVQDIAAVDAALHQLIHVPLTQGEWDALASFTFNEGEGKLASSTLLRLLNNGDKAGAAAEFCKWDKAGGRVMTGLEDRRSAEAHLFRAGSLVFYLMAGYRNPFEARVGRMLGPDFAYEPMRLPYTIDFTYTPDFVDHEHKRIVEAKGLFDAADRRKMLAVKAAHPGYQIDLCFTNPEKPICKGSKTTYRAWCEKSGFNVIAAPPRK